MEIPNLLSSVSTPRRLDQETLARAIEVYYESHGVAHERVRFGFAGPKHVGLVSRPAHAGGRSAAPCAS